MMQEIFLPLRSKLMNIDGIILKNLLQSGKNTYRSQHLINCSRFHLSKLYVPCASKYDSRSFHYSSHSAPALHNHNALLRKSQSLFSQNLSSQLQYIPSLSLHTSSDGNYKLLQSLSNVELSSCEFLTPDCLSYSQVRYLHRNSSRKRAGRTFSSQEKPSTEDKDDGKKDVVDETDEKKLTVYQRFKKTYKEHGKVLVVVHLMTSAVWFGSFYAAARCGVDVVPLLESWNLSERVIAPFRSGGLGDVALAYLMYKLATPARYTVTLGGTNLALRYLKKEGKMQQVPEEDRLRELYKDGKEDLKRKGRNTRHRLRHMRHRIQGRIPKVRKRHSHDRRDR